MPIPTNCQCGFSFAAKDTLAGRQVKCPRCTQVIQVPNAAQVAAGAATSGPRVNKKLLDLLDEAGVKSTPQGPICPACGDEMNASAVICVNCGYNVATGQYLDTYAEEDVGGVETVGMTDADKIMAKAESEIEESPIGAEDQDFGDGADSYVIAVAAMAILGVLVLVGLSVVLIMESLTSAVSTELISGIASVGIAMGCGLWITIIAFKSKPGHGVACVASIGLYCPIYGFIQGRGTILAAIVMIAAFVIGGISWIVFLSSL